MSLCSKCKYRCACADRRNDLDPILTLAEKFKY